MHGVEHICFSSGEEVLAQPWDDAVRFVLTDMRMPGMNGAELCAQLRQIAPGGVKFYVLTAQALPEERSKLLDMGFDGILMKPFHSNQLLELLEKSSTKVMSVKPVKHTVQKTEFDLSLLSEMTFGDESLMREILDQFVSDSRKDIASLQHMIDMQQTGELHELMHRMAGRTGQIGAGEISVIFRKYEVGLREDQKAIAASDISDLISRAADLVEQVEQKALSYSM
jgi:CheY-like chemotaxis protein